MVRTAPVEHLDLLRQDLRYAWRAMGSNRGFTVVVVVTLGLGIGAATAIFSVVDGVLIKPLPLPDPDRIVSILSVGPPGSGNEVSYPDMLSWREQGDGFDEIATFRATSLTLTGMGEARELPAARVTSNFFQILRVDALRGRTFVPEEDSTERGLAAILSYGLWQTQFGAAEDALGRTVLLDGRPHQVVGILPADFEFPGEVRDAEVWGTLALDLERGARYLNGIGRLRPSVDLPTAEQQLQLVSEGLAKVYPRSNQGRSVRLLPVQEHVVGETRPALLALMAGAGFLMLIACTNVASLLLGRTTARRREIALRTALGARPSRAVRQLVTESLVLSSLGGVVGLAVAQIALKSLPLLAPTLPRLNTVAVDHRILAFTVALGTFAGMAFAVMPSIHAVRFDLEATLRNVRIGTPASSSLFRRLLVVSEVALAITLLIGSGLLVRSFSNLLGAPKGFDSSNILTLRTAPPAARYKEVAQAHAFFDRLIAGLATFPGVEAVGIANQAPLTDNNFRLRLEIAGRPAPSPSERPSAEYRTVSTDYFRAMGMPVITGRGFTSSDLADSEPVVIINDIVARENWPGENPIGQRMRINNFDEPYRVVVGVVADVRHFGLDEDARAEVYVPVHQSPARTHTLVVRSAFEPMSQLGPIRQLVMSLDRDLPLYNVATMDQIVMRSIGRQRLSVLIFSVFATIALALTLVGLYGVMANSVEQRTREIGIRMALGARRGSLTRMVVGQGLGLTLAGLGIGILATSWLTEYLAGMLYEVRPTDVPTFVATSTLLLIVAAGASAVPAGRAARVDPTISLRAE